MEKIEIIQKIEHIADKSEDEQVRLNALSYLLNRIEIQEKELKLKQECEESAKDFRKKIEKLATAF